MRIILKNTFRNLILLVLINMLLLTAMIVMISNRFEQSIIALRKNELKHLVSIGVNSIEKYRSDFLNGKISREEALENITNQIRLFTYEDEHQPNYLFMSSFEGIMLVQPFEPELEGSNQINLKDAEGKFIIRELIEQAKKEPGWVTYRYYPPNSDIAYDKISYVAGLTEFDCYIGTGIYSIDIQQFKASHFRQTLIFLTVILIIMMSFATIIVWPLIFMVQIIARELIRIDVSPLLEAPIINTDRFPLNKETRQLLKRFNEIIERLADRNRSLIESAAERDRLKTEHIKNTEMLMKEMNHRIKNNLQIIISLLQLELAQTENDQIKDALLETMARLESISIIHNMLYSNEDYTSIPGDKYLYELVSYIIHSFKAQDRIKFEFNINSTDFTIDQAVTLGIITNEVITNSVKYAFQPDGQGIIRISLSRENNRHVYSIYDNGPGIPKEFLDKKNSKLGINLIKTLCKQLGGTLEINTEKGTNYKIVF